MASALGGVRRRLPAKAAAALASSLYFLQGTLQKIYPHTFFFGSYEGAKNTLQLAAG
jgi:hypothetical protein